MAHPAYQEFMDTATMVMVHQNMLNLKLFGTSNDDRFRWCYAITPNRVQPKQLYVKNIVNPLQLRTQIQFAGHRANQFGNRE